MKKLMLLFVLLVFPLSIYAQQVLAPGWGVSFLVKASTVNQKDSAGIYQLRAGFDINKNGKKEILLATDPTVSGGSTASDTTMKLYLLENDGANNYKLIWSYDIPYRINSYQDVEVADVDKDGNSEIWMAIPSIATTWDLNPPRLFCFEWDGTKLPSKPTATWNFGARDNMNLRPHNLVINDVDNDGDVEILMLSRQDSYGSSSTGGRTLIIGSTMTPIDMDGLNVFSQEYIDTSAYLKGGGTYDLKVLDYDGDGKKEIWAFTWDKFTFNVYESKASNQYSHEVEVHQAFPIDYSNPQGDLGCRSGSGFYDYNKDGKMELLVAGMAGEGSNEDGAVIYVESSTDVSKLTTANCTILGHRVSGCNPEGAVAGDFDKDGKPEFVFVDRWLRKVVQVEYKGSGSMADSVNYTWTDIYKDTVSKYPPDYVMMTASSSDMDGDGYQELIVANLDVLDPSRPMAVVLEAGNSNSVKKLENNIPQNYSLKQNYPNPFNPTTNIEFSIPKTSFVTMKIYNSIGQEVSTLIDEQKEAGNYKIDFNAKNLPSGTYFYNIQAGEFSEQMKMILIK